jgi:hypothetical protein
MNFVFATTALLVSWLCIAVVLLGLGFGLIAIARFDRPHSQPFSTAFWLGFAAVLAFLQCWHLVFRISVLPCMLLSLLAIPGLWKSRKTIAEVLAGHTRHRIALALSLSAVVYVANRSLGPCLAFDSGLYGQPAVNWFVSYPVVPGLANLQERIGFNNSIFLFYAMLDHGFWRGHSNQLVNGLLLSALLLQIIGSGRRLTARKNRNWGPELFDTVLLIPAMFIAIDPQFYNIASVVTDPAVAVLMFVGASRLLRLLWGTSEDPALDGVFVIVTGVAAIAVKLSALAFATTAGLLVCWSWLRLPPSAMSSIRSAVARSSLAAAMLIVPWLMHGLILTGYPAYPATVGGLNVDWKVPESVAANERGFIKEFARYYYDPDLITSRMVRGQYRYPSGSWIKPWILRAVDVAKGEVVIPFALTVLGLVALAGFSVAANSVTNRIGIAWLATIPALALLVQGILFGPSPRFLLPGCWILAAVVLSLGFHSRISSIVVRRAYVLVVCCIAASLVGGRALRFLSHHQLDAAITTLFNAPGPDKGFYDVPTADFRRVVTRSGLTVLSPIEDGRIWNGPLMSAPDPVPDLALRVAGSPRYGFKTLTSVDQPAGLESGSILGSRFRLEAESSR